MLVLGCSPATLTGPEGPAPNLADYLPTPPEVVERMLAIAEVTRDDVLYDLGSGDGRIVIGAARRGARAVGVELDARLVALSEDSARRERVEHLVSFRRQDATTVDVSAATVVTLYLGTEPNARLRPALQRQLRPGARVVSHAFGMGDWAPDVVERVHSMRGEEHVIYLWRIR
jgi:predicted RNA methylase